MRFTPKTLLAALTATLISFVGFSSIVSAQCDTATFQGGFCYAFHTIDAAGNDITVKLSVPDGTGWDSIGGGGNYVHQSLVACGSNFGVEIEISAPGLSYQCSFLPGGIGDASIELASSAFSSSAMINLFGQAPCTLNGGPPALHNFNAQLAAINFTGPALVPDAAQPASLDFLQADARFLLLGTNPLSSFAQDFETGPCIEDEDGDGVLDDDDICPDTALTDALAGVPSDGLRPNRFAEIDGDGVFDTPASKLQITMEDTRGCNCAQIIEALHLGKGHTRHGCSIGIMKNWLVYAESVAVAP